jgi:hypothetical protein
VPKSVFRTHKKVLKSVPGTSKSGQIQKGPKSVLRTSAQIRPWEPESLLRTSKKDPNPSSGFRKRAQIRPLDAQKASNRLPRGFLGLQKSPKPSLGRPKASNRFPRGLLGLQTRLKLALGTSKRALGTSKRFQIASPPRPKCAQTSGSSGFLGLLGFPRSQPPSPRPPQPRRP